MGTTSGHDKILKECIDSFSCTSMQYTKRKSPKIITLVTIVKNSSSMRTKPLGRTFSESMIMAYCINDVPLITENTNLRCWLCGEPESDRKIFEYNTIFGYNINLHTYCYNICNLYRGNCRKKTSTNHDYLISPNNLIIIYNISEIFLLRFSDHMSVKYNILHNDPDGLILKHILKSNIGCEFKNQYIDLIRKEFIDDHFYHWLSLKTLFIDDIVKIIMYFYVKLILFICNDHHRNVIYNLLARNYVKPVTIENILNKIFGKLKNGTDS